MCTSQCVNALATLEQAGTALHEAAARKNQGMVELLLRCEWEHLNSNTDVPLLPVSEDNAFVSSSHT
jgi:hypothetical protein